MPTCTPFASGLFTYCFSALTTAVHLPLRSMLPERSRTITISSGTGVASELVAAQAASSSEASEPPSRLNPSPPSPLDVPALPPPPPAPFWLDPAVSSVSNPLFLAFALQPQTASDQAAASAKGERR